MTTTNFQFVGTDRSLEISLFEYGFICAYNDQDNDWFVVYRAANGFDTGYKSEHELNELINGNDWMSKDDINSFLSFVGSSKDEWLNLSFAQKLGDLLNYYGHENIMGSQYTEGMNETDVTERYLN